MQSNLKQLLQQIPGLDYERPLQPSHSAATTPCSDSKWYEKQYSSQLLQQNRKASCECLHSGILLLITKRLVSPRKPVAKEICAWSWEEKQVGERLQSQQRKFFREKRRADRRRERHALRQHELQRQQLPAQELAVEMKMSAVLEERRRGMLDEAAYELGMNKIWH